MINGYDGVYNNVVVGQPRRDSLVGSSNGRPDSASPVARQVLSLFPGLISVCLQAAVAHFPSPLGFQANPLSKSGAGIICKGDGTGHEQFCIDCGGIDDAFRFFFRDAHGSTAWTRSSIRPDNKWHFLVGVCDQGHDRIYIYVDGTNAAQSTAAAGTGILATGRPTTIGARSSGPETHYDDQFIGAIGDVAIFTNALSAAQVLALHNSAKPSANVLIISATYGSGSHYADVTSRVNDLFRQADVEFFCPAPVVGSRSDAGMEQGLGDCLSVQGAAAHLYDKRGRESDCCGFAAGGWKMMPE